MKVELEFWSAKSASQGLAKKMTFDQKFKRGEREKLVDVGGKSDPGRSACRVLRRSTQNSKEASVSGIKGARGT